MKTHKETYRTLRSKLTVEELASHYVVSQEGDIPSVRSLRLADVQQMTESEKLQASILQLKYSIEEYLEQEDFEDSFSFVSCLARYVELPQMSLPRLAKAIDVPEKDIKDLLAGNAAPSVELMYRLEQHSKQTIPAQSWWQLYARALAYYIRDDQTERKEAAAKVSEVLPL